MLAMARRQKEERAAQVVPDEKTDEEIELETIRKAAADEKKRLEQEAADQQAEWDRREAAAIAREASAAYTYENDEDLLGGVSGAEAEGEAEEDVSDLDILFQFIPYYGQGDPTNDATVRAYLSALSIGDIDCKDEYGNTLLLLACQYGLGDLVRIMLNKGGDPNAVNSSGASGLHFSCYRESMSAAISKMLLHNGANPDIQETVNGCTPLHYCASTGDKSLCEMLVAYGANVGVQDFYQYTCLDYARESGVEDVVSFLQEAMMGGMRRGYGSPMGSPSPTKSGGGGQYGSFKSPGGGMGQGGGDYYQFGADGSGSAAGYGGYGSPDGAYVGGDGGGGPMHGNAPQTPGSSTMAQAKSDPLVKAALIEAEDKYTAALNDERSSFRKALTDVDEKLAKLKAQEETFEREMISMTKEVADAKETLQRAQQSGTKGLEAVIAERDELRKQDEEQTKQRDELKTQISENASKLADVESKLASAGAEVAARIAAFDCR